MGAMASQIISLTIVYPTVYSGADQRKHQSSASLAFVRRIHRWPVNSPHKWPVTRKMTSSWKCHNGPELERNRSDFCHVLAYYGMSTDQWTLVYNFFQHTQFSDNRGRWHSGQVDTAPICQFVQGQGSSFVCSLQGMPRKNYNTQRNRCIHFHNYLNFRYVWFVIHVL